MNKIYIDVMTLPAAMIEGTDPLPSFRRMTGFGLFSTKPGFPEEAKTDLGTCTRTLPYRIQDRYGRKRRMTELKTVVLENEHLKATFVPSFGGKLWSLYDKDNRREVLMSNPVVQPGNLAIRNAWTSGGIEWNFGSAGHTYFCCDDVWAAILTDPDGDKFLRIYEFERAKECFFAVDFHLPEGSRQLFSHVRLTNPGEDTTTYWWSNVAIPDDGGTRVLSSSEDVIVFCGGAASYEKLPHLSEMDGDMSYPHNATRSFDYFFQPPEGVNTTWESGVDKNGFAFYDRSTAPLVYHKMFCWGSHRGGIRWQQHLSDGDRGRYIELQAGIARSQLHDKPFPAHSSYEWTQCFGGTYVDPGMVHGLTLSEANARFALHVQELIPENQLLSLDKKYAACAQIKVKEENIVHRGSGWGALHLRLCPQISVPLCFPDDSLGEEQRPWLHLLERGILPGSDPSGISVSWMTSEKWLRLLQTSVSGKGGDDWAAQLHYGNALFEFWDNAHTVPTARYFDGAEYEKRAAEAWKRSDALCPNVWARRNLAVLYRLRGENELAEQTYRSVFSLPASVCDPCFASEYMGWLIGAGKHEEALRLYEGLPENIRGADRVTLHALRCAVKLGREVLPGGFEREYAAIREGETSLSDLWFEYHARRLAAERGEDFDALGKEEKAALTERAEELFPPPHGIDFRMSYDKNKKYRVSE